MRQCLLFILFASFLTNAFCEYVGYPMDTWIVPQPYSITSLACKDNLLLVGGDVLSVGPKTGHIAVYDRGTKKLRGNFPYVDGTVTNSVSDGSGGWFIAGDFTSFKIPVVFIIIFILFGKSVSQTVIKFIKLIYHFRIIEGK